MVCLLLTDDKLLRDAGMLCGRLWTLRRRYYCSGPVLLLGVAVCLFYQTLMVARSRFKSSQPASDERNKSTVADPEKPFDELMLTDAGRLISALETLQREIDVSMRPSFDPIRIY